MQSVSARFWSKVKCLNDGVCWEWQASRLKFGYGRFWVAGKDLKAHRVAWTLSKGIIPNGLWVLHNCDNPPCVNPHHLFLGTRQDNEDDKYRKGRGVTGSRNGRTARTELDVAAIRNCYEYGIKQAVIAEMYDIEKTTLSAIIRHKSWK